MTLKTGKLTLIGDNGNESELKTTGKVFRIGSYLSCDLVLDNPEARSIHCEIQSDSFGRITITNHSKSNPVRINGVPLKGTRPLYTGSVISIFEKSLKWVNKHRLPRNMVDIDKNQTPNLGFKRADQAPNSEPSGFMRRRHAAKRMTMHNFGERKYLSDEDEAVTLRDGNDENKRQDRLTRASIMSAAKTIGATPPRSACRSKILRRTTIDVANSAEVKNESVNQYIANTPEVKKLALLKCQSSGMVVTSYSPNATPKKKNSFALVVSTKNTPNSAYKTPRSALSDLNSSECIENLNSTPKTPKDTCAMHLIDFTTPDVYKTPLQKRTPLFRSALKNSAVKSVSKGPIKDDLNSTTKSCTPSSVKKLRWNTSEQVMKSETQSTPLQITLNKSTPFNKSTITSNKLRQSIVSRSVGKRSYNRLSQSISETPPILTRRTLKTSSTKVTHSISRLAPALKRKSLNVSSPLKTPKEIFSANKSATSNNSQLSSVRNPNASESMLVQKVESYKISTCESGVVLDRSKTFILDGPSVAQVTNENDIDTHIQIHPEDVNNANNTFTCEDSEIDTNEENKLTEEHKMQSNVDLIESNCRLEEDLLNSFHPEITNQINSHSESAKRSQSTQQNSSGQSFNLSETHAENSHLLPKMQCDYESVNLSQQRGDCLYDHEKGKILNSTSKLLDETSVLNKSSLNNTFDKTETSKKHETPRRRSLRRRSEKDLVEINDSNVEELRNLSIQSNVSHEEKVADKTRKSLTLSKSSTNIESIAPQDEAEHNKSNVLAQSAHTEAALVKNGCKSKNEQFNAQKNKSTESSPKLFAIKELMKTPKTPAEISLHGVKELMKIRKSFVGLKNVVGVKELFNTPKQEGLSDFVGVKEMVKTPILNGGLVDTKGVKELFNTPARNDITDVFGVKELMNTPKSCAELNDLKGMKELFNTPNRDDLTDVFGVKELVNTPKPSAGLSNGVGLKELFNTPARDDLTDVFGVKELVNTPLTERGFEDLKGVKELFNTPAPNDVTDFLGVKELVNTPKPEICLVDSKGVKELFKTPIENTGIIDAKGVKELFNTPKTKKELNDGAAIRELFKTPNTTLDIADVKGVKASLNTPARSNISDNTNSKGLMKSPLVNSPSGMQHSTKTSRNPLYDEADGMDDVFKTPASREVMVLNTPKSICVEKSSTSAENLLKTPKEINVLEDIDDVGKIFQTPVSNLINSGLEDEESVHLSPEESFDKLVGKPAIRRTYARASVTPRILSIPIGNESGVDVAKTDIQEWIDNVNIENGVENAERKRIENAIKSSIVKLHRKPLATSSSIKPTKRRSTRLMRDIKDAELKEVSGIEQLEDSFLSSSEEISDVFIDKDESSKAISVETTNDDSTISKRKSHSKNIFVTSNTPQKFVQIVTGLSKQALKPTPQIRRLRNRVSTPYSRNEAPRDPTNDPFADLSIQYIDESSVKASSLRSNTPLRYKIRKSRKADDVSIELIDSGEVFGKQTEILNKTSNDTTINTEVEYISVNESAEKNNSTMVKRNSRKTVMRSGCIISISDEELINDTAISKDQTKELEELSKIEESSKQPGCETVEFVAANELSVISNHGKSLHSIDAFKSLNDSENITLIDISASIEDVKQAPKSGNVSLAHSASEKSLSYEEEEDKLLDLYETHLSTGEMKDRTLGVVYVDPNNRIENTNIANDVGANDFEEKESTSIGNDSRRISLKSTSQISVDDESLFFNNESRDCQIIDENEFDKSDASGYVEIPIQGKSFKSNEMENSLNNICVEDALITKSNTPNCGKGMSNEFDNFLENPDRKKRVGGNSLTPVVNKKGQAKHVNRKTLGGVANSSPIDVEAEKMKLEFSNFNMNPKVMISRGTSQLDFKTSRMTISRRTTGKLPLNPNFNVQHEKDRRNLSIEFQNFDSTGMKRALRGRSLSPVKPIRVEKGRRTNGQNPLTNKSFDPKYELERRNMSIEFSRFEAVPSARHGLRGRSLAYLKEKADIKSRKDRFTMGQKSNNLFDYNVEVERRNMSLEFEHFHADERIAMSSRRRTIGVNKVSVLNANKRLSEDQNARSTCFDLKAEQERRKLSLEFKNFDEHASKKTRTCGYSDIFRSSSSNSTVRNNRRTLGERPLSESFDMKNEVERYHIEREFDNFDADNYPTGRHRGQSQSPVKKSKVQTLTQNRFTVGQPPLEESFDIEIEKRRNDLENMSTFPILTYRGSSLSPPTCIRKHDFEKKRMTLGDRSNSSFDIGVEKKKMLEQKKPTKNSDSNFDFDPNNRKEENRHIPDQIISTSAKNEPDTVEEVMRTYVVVVDKVMDSKDQDELSRNDQSNSEDKDTKENGTIKSTSKCILKINEKGDLECETDTKSRHVRFGENIYYEISGLEAHDSNENRKKNVCGEKKQKLDSVDQTDEKFPSRLRSRKTRESEDSEIIEKVLKHCIEAVPKEANQNNHVGEENKENLKTRRGKRTATAPRRKPRKGKPSEDLESSQLSAQKYQNEELSDSEKTLIHTPQPGAEVLKEVVAPEKLPLTDVGKEINRNDVSDDTTQNKKNGNGKTRRGKRLALSTKKTDPETIDDNLNVEEVTSQKKDLRENTIKQDNNTESESNETVINTRTRRGNVNTSRNVVIMEDQSKNLVPEKTSSINPSDIDINSRKPLTRTKEKPSFKSTEKEILDMEESVPKTRNRRGKKIESATSTQKTTCPNVEPVENEITNENSGNVDDNFDTSKDIHTNKSSEKPSPPAFEPILKIHSLRTDVKEPQLVNDEDLKEDKKPLRKVGRPRKIAQTDIEVRSSPRNKVKLLTFTHNSDQTETQQGNKPADNTLVTTNSNKITTIEAQSQQNGEHMHDTDEESMSKGKHVRKPKTRNTRQNILAENVNNSETKTLKRSRRLVSTDVESEKNSEKKPVDRSSSSQISVEVESNNIKIERKTRGENARRKPLLEKPLNVETSPEIMPAKRTRRLASHSDMAATNLKSNRRAVRAANEDDNQDEDNVIECATVGEVSKTNDGKVKSENFKRNPSGHVSNATDPSYSDPVTSHRTRRLVSVDERLTNVMSQDRTGRTKGKKEGSIDSQSYVGTEIKTSEHPDEKSAEDTVFKTPNEVKPKRRGARLRSTNDTPSKDSSEIENAAPVRITRRLLSVEATSIDTPDVNEDTKTRTTRLKSTKVPSEKSNKHLDSETPVDTAEKKGDSSIIEELSSKVDAPKIKSRRGQKGTTQSELSQDAVIAEIKIPSGTENIEEMKVQNADDIEKKNTRQTRQPKVVQNDTDTALQGSVSKTARQGRRTKRRAESDDLDVEEVVTRTRSRRK